MKKTLWMVILAGAMGMALLAAGGCCHIPHHHGCGSSCCEKRASCDNAPRHGCRCSDYEAAGDESIPCQHGPSGCPKGRHPM